MRRAIFGHQALLAAFALSVIASCAEEPEREGELTSPESVETRPEMAMPLPGGDAYLELELSEPTPLGFSGQDALEAFQGEYSAVIHYAEGGTTDVTLSVEPSGKLLSGDLAEPAPVLVPRGGDRLSVSVDVEFASGDGQFSERFESTLQAYSLGLGRIGREFRMSGTEVPSRAAKELAGTFEFDPSTMDAGIVWLLIDLHGGEASDGGGHHRTTSGMFGGRPPSPPGASGDRWFAIEPMLTWGGCQLIGYDAGWSGCEDELLVEE